MNEALTKTMIHESRLARAEASVASMQDDIKEIKRNIRMILGLVFSLNSTIIGLLAKGFNLI